MLLAEIHHNEVRQYAKRKLRCAEYHYRRVLGRPCREQRAAGQKVFNLIETTYRKARHAGWPHTDAFYAARQAWRENTAV